MPNFTTGLNFETEVIGGAKRLECAGSPALCVRRREGGTTESGAEAHALQTLARGQRLSAYLASAWSSSRRWWLHLLLSSAAAARSVGAPSRTTQSHHSQQQESLSVSLDRQAKCRMSRSDPNVFTRTPMSLHDRSAHPLGRRHRTIVNSKNPFPFLSAVKPNVECRDPTPPVYWIATTARWPG